MKLLFCILFQVLCFNLFAADTPSVSVYPNPFESEFTIEINSPIEQTAILSILNSNGQQLLIKSVYLKKGTTLLLQNLSNTPNGIYFLRFEGNDWTKITKIVQVANNATPTRSSLIDIVHYDLSLSIRNLSTKTIQGTAKLIIASKANNLSSLTLDLLKLNTDSVKMNGVLQTFTRTDSTLNITLNQPKQTNDTFELIIFYKGQPSTDALWGGFYFNGNYAYNMGVGFQAKPHNFGRCWFPCVDDFVDRATYSFHITTDATFKAVCNGLMQPETNNPDGSTTWNWQLNQTIPTYLASVAVGKYEFVKYEFQGINRTYPVWLAVIPADSNKLKASFAKLNTALQCFEQRYGAYSFDRVGYVGVPFNAGAMEHATNIAYPIYAINGNTDYETLFAHELAHMWWGDLVTCRTAEDMWLNEGWASFNEALFLECAYGKNAYTDDIEKKSIDVLKNALTNDGAWYPVSGVPHNATYGTHVYKKGALMVHTLRSIMGDDAFFAACKSYLLSKQFKDANTEDLKNEFQKFTPVDLSKFFQKWIYSSGHSDIVVSDFSTKPIVGNPNVLQYHFEFKELSRQNTLTSPQLPFTIRCYTPDSFMDVNLLLKNGEAIFDTILTNDTRITGWNINPDYKIQLAHITQEIMLTAVGVNSLQNANLSVNVGKLPATGSTTLRATQHFVGPLYGDLKSKGIRISTERYWHIDGLSDNGLLMSGTFNYNGTTGSFLDEALMTKTEDSLVLLYRQFPGNEWQIVDTGMVFQPGVNRNDKAGRFTVNNLRNGDYTFGMRDASVVGIAELQGKGKEQTNSVILIPNPTGIEKEVQVLLSHPSYVKTLEVINNKGVKVYETRIENNIQRFNLSTNKLTKGLYIVSVFTQNGVLSAKLLVDY